MVTKSMKQTWVKPAFYQISYLFSLSLSLFFWSFLGGHLWHMEVPRLGVLSEL